MSRMRLLKKEQVYHCFFFVFFLVCVWGGGGGGWTIFPWSGFIKAIISVHMYIVRSSICHPSKYQTSKFFFLDFQNLHPGSLAFQNLKVSGSPVISGQCHNGLMIMKAVCNGNPFTNEKILPREGFKPGTARSVGQC